MSPKKSKGEVCYSLTLAQHQAFTSYLPSPATAGKQNNEIFMSEIRMERNISRAKQAQF